MANRDRSRSPNRAGGPTGTRHGSVVEQYDHQYDHYDEYGYGSHPGPGPPAHSGEPVVGNEAEIIVAHRDQCHYAEMIEKRIKAESGLSSVDMLFLHTPSSLNMTLNVLFERSVTCIVRHLH